MRSDFVISRLTWFVLQQDSWLSTVSQSRSSSAVILTLQPTKMMGCCKAHMAKPTIISISMIQSRNLVLINALFSWPSSHHCCSGILMCLQRSCTRFTTASPSRAGPNLSGTLMGAFETLICWYVVPFFSLFRFLTRAYTL